MNAVVSIITPSYNCEKFISETIESVLSQSYMAWEMIVVDDLSTDGSWALIQEYAKQEDRIHAIQLERNSGAAVARNTAIEKARGKYIAFLDSDDLWEKDKLEKQVNFMQSKDLAFTYAPFKLITEEGVFMQKIKTPPEQIDYFELLKENQIGCLTAMYDQEKLGKCYMPLIRKRQDYGLWLNLLKKCGSAYSLPDVCSSYRVRVDSISRNKIEMLKYNYMLFKNHEQMSTLRAMYYVGWNVFRKLSAQRRLK